MRHKGNILFVGVSIILGCLIGILTGEAMLRIFTPSWLARRMQELNAGYARQFGSDRGWTAQWVDGKFKSFTPLSKFRVEYCEYNHIVNIDEMGGRLTAFQPAGANETMVPFLGDSVCFGIGVKDDETYVSLLSDKLKLHCLNLGIPGTNLSHQLDVLELRHREIGSPSLYVFNFFLDNDILGYPAEKPKDDKKKQATDKLTDAFFNINNYVYHHPFFKRIYIIQFIRAKIIIFYNKFARQQLMEPIFITMNKNNRPDIEKEIDTGLEIELQRLIRLSKTLRFKPIFILIPDRHQVYPNLLKVKAAYYGFNIEDIDAGQPNKIIAKRLSAKNILYIDILEDLRMKKEDALYYIQDNHLTKAGHKAVAECVYPHFPRLR